MSNVYFKYESESDYDFDSIGPPINDNSTAVINSGEEFVPSNEE